MLLLSGRNELVALNWVELGSSTATVQVYPTKLPGGWLIDIWDHAGCGMTFYPDALHQRKGSSLP